MKNGITCASRRLRKIPTEALLSSPRETRCCSSPAARRVENRVPGVDVNPYIAMAASLACGYLGLMNKTNPRAEFSGNAYIDSESPNGTTPLMLAANSTSALTVKLLLEEGADPTLVNHGNASALDFAIGAEQIQSQLYLRAFLESWDIQNSSE